jgi:hypothetical protein
MTWAEQHGRTKRERITDDQLASLDSKAPAVADYIRDRRRRGVGILGRRWHRGS